MTVVEERVVLFRARSFTDAIRQAEREARKYAKALPAHRNVYGQRVVTSYLGACDAFESFGAPRSGREAYSRMEVAGAKVSDRAIVDRLLGARRPRGHARMFEPS